MEFWACGLSRVCKGIGVDGRGLKSREVEKQKAQFGANELEKQAKISLFARFFAQFKNMMVIVLLISAVISVTLSLVKGHYEDLFEGGIIFAIVIINAIIGVIQEKKAEDSLALLAQKTGTHTKVFRDQKWQIIDTKDVVVGDLVELKAGDYVPADMRLIETHNLKCDESSLTGESHAVFKNADVICDEKTPLADRANIAFSGTNVTFGKGTGIVVKVGRATQMGAIAKILNKQIKDKSPLEKNIDKIGKIITFGVLATVAVVFVTELIFCSRLNVLEAFLISVALAVAAIPESLPAVITIIMALGVERLAKKGAIVKTLNAVETLGCCNVICSDKTGTLTQNKMQVKHIYTGGKLFNADEFNANLNADLMRAIVLCNNAKLSSGGQILGDATETSLLRFAYDKKIDIDAANISCPRVLEVPFDSTSKLMTTVNTINGNNVIITKGAFDYLLKDCSQILINGRVEALSIKLKNDLLNIHKFMGRQAERIIAVAACTVEKTQNDAQNLEKVAKNRQNMVFLGLFGIVDPPRPNVKNSINKCVQAGLKPIMITGDHPDTALAIAKEIGIAKNEAEVITGQELASLSVKELREKLGQFSVFCRVSPEDKVKIVRALRGQGHVVAMTGDGVNDAPSLKMADIGVGMGSGTDVTKSVSDLILTNDDYSTIVVAIEEGRTIYSNIQKTLQFLLSTNAVEVLGIFITALIMKNAVFLLPSQILFINLITDSLPAFALGLEPPEKDLMKHPPRNTKQSLFAGEVGTAIIYQAFVQTLIVLVMFVVANAKLGNEIASTMVFLTICYMQILHAVNCKTNKSLFKIKPFANITFNLSFIALFALITAVGVIPIMQKAFNIVALNLTQWLIVAFFSISIIPAVEFCKFLLHFARKSRKNLINSAKPIKNTAKTA